MKEMEYKGKQSIDILFEGEYEKYHFVIVSYGTHPCAYVELPKNHPLYGIEDNYDADIDVHGGITFARHLRHVLGERGDGFYLGWDYAHVGDFSGHYFNDFGDKELKEINSKLMSIITVNGPQKKFLKML